MIQVVEIKPGEEAIIKQIPTLHFSYGEELFGETWCDFVDLGNDLYVTVGDSAALMGKPMNFSLSGKVDVRGPAVFEKRIWEPSGETFDYKSLSDREAAVIVELLKRNRETFNVQELYDMLGWSY